MSEYVSKPDIEQGIQNVKRQRGAAVRALVPRIPHSVPTLTPDDMKAPLLRPACQPQQHPKQTPQP